MVLSIGRSLIALKHPGWNSPGSRILHDGWNFQPEVGPGLSLSSYRRCLLVPLAVKRRPNVWGTLIALDSLAFGVEGLGLCLFPRGGLDYSPFPGSLTRRAVALASREGVIRVPRVRRKEDVKPTSMSNGEDASSGDGDTQRAFSTLMVGFHIIARLA